MSLNEDTNFHCPYCGSPNSLQADVSAGNNQKLITDCETCCSPIVVRIGFRGGAVVHCEAQRENNPE